MKILSIYFLSFWMMYSCSENKINKNDLQNTQMIFGQNKFSNEEIYTHGDLTLHKSSNLPITGFIGELYYLNGKKHGEYKFFNKDSSINYIQNYFNGEQHGLTVHYYENGRKNYECKYFHGKNDGVLKEWYENGRIKKFFNYSKGLRI